MTEVLAYKAVLAKLCFAIYRDASDNHLSFMHH